MPRPPRARTCATLVASAALLVLPLAGCAGALAGLPDPGPDVRREAVDPRGTTCTGGRCTHGVRVGGRRLVVRADVRERSPDELRGRTAGTVARGAASAMAGAVMRRNGFTTNHLSVGLGARVVEDEAGGLRLACEVAWIDDVMRERVSGEERSSAMPLAEGWRCDAADRADTTAVRWTLRGGIAPDVDSLEAVVALLERGEVGTIALDRPMELARAGTAGAGGYVVTRDEGHGRRVGLIDVRAERWVVRRADGALVGVVHHSALPHTALDVALGADDDEAALMRLLAATIVVPLR